MVHVFLSFERRRGPRALRGGVAWLGLGGDRREKSCATLDLAPSQKMSGSVKKFFKRGCHGNLSSSLMVL